MIKLKNKLDLLMNLFFFSHCIEYSCITTLFYQAYYSRRRQKSDKDK